MCICMVRVVRGEWQVVRGGVPAVALALGVALALPAVALALLATWPLTTYHSL